MDVCYVWMCVELLCMDACGIVPHGCAELLCMDVCGIVTYGCVWNCYVWMCVDLLTLNPYSLPV